MRRSRYRLRPIKMSLSLRPKRNSLFESSRRRLSRLRLNSAPRRRQKEFWPRKRLMLKPNWLKQMLRRKL